MTNREPEFGVGQVPIKRAAVLGAGTMGSQIAGLLADRGIPCDLLDLRSEGEPFPENEGELAQAAPCSSNGLAASSLMSCTTSGSPALSTQPAMGSPMFPSPINPTFIVSLSSK